MRTHDELLAEARRVEAIGDLYLGEHRRAAIAGGAVQPRIIPTFLESPARWLEVEAIEGALEYRLAERASQPGGSPRLVFASDSAFDVLAEGDELEEKEALGERIAPLVDRIGRHEFDDSVEPSVVQEVEAMLDAGELDPASQLKTRAEIVEFLAGEMEPSRLVGAVVERRSQRETEREAISQRHDERRIIQEL